MSQAQRIPVEPALLQWARKTAGMDILLASKRIGVSEASVRKWESGDLQPTIKQLRRASKVYRRPLAVLLLPSPPKDFQPLRDFRRLSDDLREDWSPATC